VPAAQLVGNSEVKAATPCDACGRADIGVERIQLGRAGLSFFEAWLCRSCANRVEIAVVNIVREREQRPRRDRGLAR
jgi:hypothetical protein